MLKRTSRHDDAAVDPGIHSTTEQHAKHEARDLFKLINVTLL